MREPLVSIGLPVFDGEEFLRLALESLLAQDYPHFELIISDNGSRDRTEHICRDFQRRDSRIRYIRHEENRGSPWNFAFVLCEARGEYFMWAAHDDLWHPTYIRKCLGKLEAHPEAVLCCTEINFIDDEGRPSVHYPNYKNIDTLGMPPVERIRELMSLPGWFATYGLMRRKLIPPVPSARRVFGWDVIHLLEMSFVGTFAKVPELLFTFRIAAGARTAEEYSEVFKSRDPAPTMPYTELVCHLLETVYRSALSPEEKAHVYAHFILACRKNPWRVSLMAELLGSEQTLDDPRFALLLGMALNRSVPLDELKRNPLAAAVYQSVAKTPNLVEDAEKLLCAPKRFMNSETQEDQFTLATSLYELGRFEEATQLFEQSIRAHETSAGWHNWATVQLARKRIDDAERGFRHAILLDPTNYVANAKLGIILARTGRSKDAAPFMKQGMLGMGLSDRLVFMDLMNDYHAENG